MCEFYNNTGSIPKHVRKYKGENLRKQQDKSKAQNKMLETYLSILLIMITINNQHPVVFYYNGNIF